MGTRDHKHIKVIVDAEVKVFTATLAPSTALHIEETLRLLQNPVIFHSPTQLKHDISKSWKII